jgi:hypothetical protein
MSDYFWCGKCGGTFDPSYTYCPNCDGAVVMEQQARISELVAQCDVLMAKREEGDRLILRLTEERAEAKAQRDELLAAMEAFVSRFDNIGESPLLPTISGFRAVIVKVKS